MPEGVERDVEAVVRGVSSGEVSVSETMSSDVGVLLVALEELTGVDGVRLIRLSVEEFAPSSEDSGDFEQCRKAPEPEGTEAPIFNDPNPEGSESPVVVAI